MGKSTSSCFKLITCSGGDAAENDASQFQDSNDKRGWSFRKKSPRHRVLSNTALAAETPSSAANKQSSECSNFNIQPLPEPNIVSNISTTNNDDKKPQLSSFESSESNVIEAAESKVGVNPPESDVIEAGSEAQRELLQLKNVVKLQAAVRGYLVRKHAVGTLHCVQAITKDVDELEKFSSPTDRSEKNKDCASVCPVETGIPPDINSKPTVGDSVLLSEDEEKVITSDDTNFMFQASCPTLSIVKDDLEQVSPEETIAYDAKVASAETESFQNENSASEASAPPELNVNYLDQKPEIDGDQQKISFKRFVSDQIEAEDLSQKPVNGSTKVSNPAFVAAQSKFEELSSMSNSGRTSSLPYQDAAVEFESQGDSSFVVTDTAYRSKESSSENPGPYISRVGGSECGTELSITSALDSPVVSEVGAMENERDAKDFVEGTGNLENTINHYEANVPCTLPAPNLATSVLDHSEIVDDIGGNMVPSVAAVDSKKPIIETETNGSDLQKEQAEAVLQDLRSSPEASPRSHVTVPESQGTPSSQVSVNPRKGKTKKSRSSNKRTSLSMGNNSPANANHDSGSRGSGEQLPKDQRNGKRRNSFGSVKPDHIDQEPKDNTSSNSSLPRFMQATQSARAKVNANNSPRSSPDVHEGDIQVIKRHSLPGSTGRQVSPRIQRSMSQAQQGTKGNIEQPPQERKWLR